MVNSRRDAHQVWKINPREPDLSTGGSTTLCVKAEETGPYAPK
jgi:hypothetical protein